MFSISEFTRDRLLYIIGAFQLVFTPFILFYNMTLAKYLHVAKFFVLMPLRFLSFRKQKWHYYMLEFCYYAGFILNLFILQEQFLNGVYNKYFIVVYAFATGPLLFAIYLNADKLFLHSQSHLTTTYIHLTPALMVWGLRWHNNGDDFKELFPIDFSCNGIITSYRHMFQLTFPVYMVWAVSYYLYMFVFKWKNIYEKDNLTMFRQFAEKKGSHTEKIASKAKSKYTKGLLYLIIHGLQTVITTFFAMIMFNNYYINTGFIVFTFLVTNWFGSFKLIKALHFYDTYRKTQQDKTQSIETTQITGTIRRIKSAPKLSMFSDVIKIEQT